MNPIAGVFVGGASTRMRGKPKGLLPGPDGVILVERLRSRLVAVGATVVLVGEHEAYAELGLPMLKDDPPGIGPLGGLVSLLRHAGGRPTLAFACDMPFVSSEIAKRLLAAPLDAPIVAPRRDGRWEPLCARYDPPRVLPLARSREAASRRSLQGLLDDAPAWELPISRAEEDELRDWDTPEDITSS